MRLVDHEAVILDLRARLASRSSWGTPQLRTLIDELEQQHRVDESADQAVLRRFGDHVVDVVLGELPDPVTITPLDAGDRVTPAAMEGGAAIPSPSREESCPTHPQHPPPPSPRTATSRSALAATC